MLKANPNHYMATTTLFLELSPPYLPSHEAWLLPATLDIFDMPSFALHCHFFCRLSSCCDALAEIYLYFPIVPLTLGDAFFCGINVRHFKPHMAGPNSPSSTCWTLVG